MKTFDYDIRQIKADEKGHYPILDTLKQWGAEGWQLVCGEWRSSKKVIKPGLNDFCCVPREIEERVFEAIIMKEV